MYPPSWFPSACLFIKRNRMKRLKFLDCRINTKSLFFFLIENTSSSLKYAVEPFEKRFRHADATTPISIRTNLH